MSHVIRRQDRNHGGRGCGWGLHRAVLPVLILAFVVADGQTAFGNHNFFTFDTCCENPCPLDCGAEPPVLLFAMDTTAKCVPNCHVTVTEEATSSTCHPKAGATFTLRRFASAVGDECNAAGETFSVQFTLEDGFDIDRADVCEVFATEGSVIIVEGEWDDESAGTGVLTADGIITDTAKRLKKWIGACVPTVSTWGLAALLGLVLTAATLLIRPRRRVAS